MSNFLSRIPGDQSLLWPLPEAEVGDPLPQLGDNPREALALGDPPHTHTHWVMTPGGLWPFF